MILNSWFFPWSWLSYLRRPPPPPPPLRDAPPPKLEEPLLLLDRAELPLERLEAPLNALLLLLLLEEGETLRFPTRSAPELPLLFIVPALAPLWVLPPC